MITGSQERLVAPTPKASINFQSQLAAAQYPPVYILWKERC